MRLDLGLGLGLGGLFYLVLLGFEAWIRVR